MLDVMSRPTMGVSGALCRLPGRSQMLCPVTVGVWVL